MRRCSARPLALGYGGALLLAALALGAATEPAGAADRGADGRFDTRRSSHFVLHQDVAIDRRSGWRGSLRFEREVLAALEAAYERLDRHLGLRPRRPVVVVLYDPEVFERSFAGLFRFPAAGFYHGTIRVRGDVRLTGALVRVLHHELVHAALDQAAPSLILPAWLNEGLAEWFEARAIGRRAPAAGAQARLVHAQRSGTWLPLAALSAPGLGHLAPELVTQAYLQAYAFVSHLARLHGEASLGELCEALIRTGRLERSVQRVFGRDLAALEHEFAAAIASGR